VRLVIDTTDRADFEVVCTDLVDAMGRWADAHRRTIDPWVARVVLEYKWGSADGHLGRWNGEHLADLLCEWFPERVSLGEGDVDLVVPTVGALLEFLAATGNLEAGSEPLERLEAALTELAHEFLEAMQDGSRQRLGAALVTAMQADGIDVADSGEVRHWIDGFNQHPGRQRAVLGWENARAAAEGPLDPFEDDPTASADDARATPMLARLRGLLDLVGEGRRLTAGGRLRAADSRAWREQVHLTEAELDWTLRWAHALHAVEVADGFVRPTSVGPALDAEPLSVWEAAYEAVVDLGVATGGRSSRRAPWREHLDAGIDDLLAYLSGTDGVPLDELVELLALDAAVAVDGTTDGPHRREIEADAGQVLDRLLFTGVVAEAPIVRRRRRRIVATPLGAHVLARLQSRRGHPAYVEPNDEPAIPARRRRPTRTGPAASADGSAGAGSGAATGPAKKPGRRGRASAPRSPAPVQESLFVDPGADALLRRVAGRSRALGEPAIRAWLRERGRGGLDDLAAAVRKEPTDPSLVEAGFLALTVAGRDAVDLVAALASDPALEAPALLWLLEHAAVDLPPLSVESPPAHAVASLAHLMSEGGEAPAVKRLGDLGSLDEVAAFVSEWWIVPGRATERVLDAVAGHHPDRSVARAARKALLKLRTAQV
jgi:hypothetical protein